MIYVLARKPLNQFGCKTSLTLTLSPKAIHALIVSLLCWPRHQLQQHFPTFCHMSSRLWQRSPLQFHTVSFEKKEIAQFRKLSRLISPIYKYIKNKRNFKILESFVYEPIILSTVLHVLVSSKYSK